MKKNIKKEQLRYQERKRSRLGDMLADPEFDYSVYKEPLKPIIGGFGYYGAKAYTKDGKFIQCHICGDLFKKLGSHINNNHNMLVKDYRDKFELKQYEGLISPESSWKASEVKSDPSAVEAFKKRVGASNLEKKGKKIRRRDETLEKRNTKGTCPDQLKEKLEFLKIKLGRIPKQLDIIEEYGQVELYAIKKYYGSYNKFLSFHGLKVKVRTWSKTEVEFLLRKFFEKYGRSPIKPDFLAHDSLPYQYIVTKFYGSMDKMRRDLGFPPVFRGRIFKDLLLP